MIKTASSPCQCEHVAHFERHLFTPNGNPGHSYGVNFLTEWLQTVPTTYGPFTVCPDCARDCHGGSR